MVLLSESSHFQTLFDAALRDYERQTGTKLAEHPLAKQLDTCDSVQSVTAMLQKQAQGFSKFRGEDSKAMKSLNRGVHVLFMLSDSTVLGEGVGLVFSPARAIFAGLAILLSTVKEVNASDDALVDLLESIEHFLNRLDIYTKVPPTGAMADILVKIMIELLSAIALVTKHVKQKGPIKLVKKLLGENDVEAVLQRLDRLTQDEARATAAQTLEVLYGLVQNMRTVLDNGQASAEGVRGALELLQQSTSKINKPKRDRLQRDIRKWLSPPDPWKNHNIARGSHHEGTATWFIHGTRFSEWKYSVSGSLLWVNGKPGAGKSILCSTIIEDINSMRKRGLASLAFFYCDFRDDLKKDRRGLLSSILLQLCDQSDSYSTLLSNFYVTHRRGTQGPTDKALTECLKDILRLPGQAPVYIILDALDECPNTSAMPTPREKVLELVEDLVDSHFPNFHMCITSRPESDIKLVLDPLGFHSVSIHGESGQRQDIDNYINSFVHTDPMMQNWKAEDKQLVINVLTKKADGMFRWAYCQLVYLSHCLPGRIRHALEELPESLDETYERTLQDIDRANWEFAHRLFQCVSVASRPLRVEELNDFLAFDFETGSIPEFCEDWRPDDPVDAVLSTCRSLLAVVDVDGSTLIQFSHFSVKEFLTSTRLAESGDATTCHFHVSMTPAHTLVARACLGILLHLDDKVTSGSLEDYPLSEYAALNWLGHARIEHVSENIQDGVKRLFDPNTRHLDVWLWICDLKTTFWRRPDRSEKPSKPRGTPLHYAAVSGLHDIVKFLVEEHGQVVDAQGFYKDETPLSSASRSGHLEVVRVLLQYGADAGSKDERKSTPLHRASEGGHLNVARILIKHGAKASTQDVDKSTPLHAASQGGHLGVCQVLLDEGADARAQDGDNSTPLHWASQGGHLDIVQVLLENGADAGAEDVVRWTPLHAAAQGGHLDVARALLGHGANAFAQDDDKWTPLHRASEGGHLDVVRVLLDHGADARAPDEDRWTPLHRASQRGHLSVARVLLEHGADAGAPTKQKWTPLHWASQGGHLSVVRVVLEHGADASAKTKHKWTPLHWAAERGHLEIARVLLEYGADASAQNDKNWTPFREASENGHRGIMQLLMEHGAVELGFNHYGTGRAA